MSFKRSRRERSIDVAERRSILKNYQDTYYPRFSFTPKTGIASPKRVFRFYRVNAIPDLGVKRKWGSTCNGNFSRQTGVQPHQLKVLVDAF